MPTSGNDRFPSGTTAAATAPRVPDYRRPDLEPLRVARALPAHADTLPALTVSFTRTTGPTGAVTRQVMSRIPTRVHVQTGPTGAPEWLFTRNPVDPRRAAGYLIDHWGTTVRRWRPATGDPPRPQGGSVQFGRATGPAPAPFSAAAC